MTTSTDAPVPHRRPTPRWEAPLPTAATHDQPERTFINNGTGTTTITDANPGAVVGGIAVTGTTGMGTWAYSLDGTTFTPSARSPASSALLLPSTAELRYTPERHGQRNCHDHLLRLGHDQRHRAGAPPTPTTNGGTTAFSIATDTASLAVNDAPVLTAASPSLGTTD